MVRIAAGFQASARRPRKGLIEMLGTEKVRRANPAMRVEPPRWSTKRGMVGWRIAWFAYPIPTVMQSRRKLPVHSGGKGERSRVGAALAVIREVILTERPTKSE